MDELNQRILVLMDQLGLNKSSFSQSLGVSLAVLTHISTGRNKPGLDIIQKILDRFPKVSPDWLLLGKGEMFRSLPKTQDFSKIRGALSELGRHTQLLDGTQQTVMEYHKILLDELRHLAEMHEKLSDSAAFIARMKQEINRIEEDLKLKESDDI